MYISFKEKKKEVITTWLREWVLQDCNTYLTNQYTHHLFTFTDNESIVIH